MVCGLNCFTKSRSQQRCIWERGGREGGREKLDPLNRISRHSLREHGTVQDPTKPLWRAYVIRTMNKDAQNTPVTITTWAIQKKKNMIHQIKAIYNQELNSPVREFCLPI
jgi:hypothetical protein